MFGSYFWLLSHMRSSPGSISGGLASIDASTTKNKSFLDLGPCRKDDTVKYRNQKMWNTYLLHHPRLPLSSICISHSLLS